MPTNAERLRSFLNGRPDELVGMTIDQIMHKKGLGKRDAYTLRKLATAEVASAGADNSLAGRILEVLKNGPVNDVQELRQALFFRHEDLHASPLEVSKAVWSLQKRNKVTFYERKSGGGDSLLTKIKLTRSAMADLGVIPTREHLAPSTVKPSRELKRPSPVGKDMTHPSRHHHIAKGGEVERINAPEKMEPEIVPTPAYVVPAVPERPRYAAPEPLPANMKPIIDDKKAGTKKAPDLADYPLLLALIGRADKRTSYEEAAKALEGIDDETALELLEKVKLTPFEEEVVRYVRAM